MAATAAGAAQIIPAGEDAQYNTELLAATSEAQVLQVMAKYGRLITS
jgi:hypothetical protein